MTYPKSRLPGPATWLFFQELAQEAIDQAQRTALHTATTQRISFTDDTVRAKLDEGPMNIATKRPVE